MPSPNAVDQFLSDEGVIDLTAELPDRHIKPHLLAPLSDWCFDQQIAVAGGRGAWRKHLDSELSKRGASMCLSLQIPAIVVRDLDVRIQAQPDFLLRLLDWLIRDIVERARDELEMARMRLSLARMTVPSRPTSVTPHSPRTHSQRKGSIGTLERDVEKLQKHATPLPIVRLERLLSEGRSGWRAGVDPPGLVERVTQQERQQYDAATERGDVAAKHLQTAWRAAWGIEQDGQKAFDESVKALEALLKPEVSPNNDAATLATILGDIKSRQSRFTSRFERTLPSRDSQRADGFGDEGVQLLHGLVGSIWRSQRRHADSEAHLNHDIEQGRDAVTLTVALVAIQRRGFMTRT